MQRVIIILTLLCIFNSESFSQFSNYRTKTSGRDTSKYSERNIDVRIFRTFNNINSRFVNSLISISNESIIPVSVAAPVGLYTVARINGNYYDESSAVLLALSEFTSLSVTQILKSTVKRDRPFRKLNNVYLSDTSSVAGTYSFPSGHSSESFSIATLLTLRYPDKPGLIIGLYSYAAVVSLGRIYWGVHYPSDVLTGMLIGAGSAALIYSLRKPIIKAKNDLFNQNERTDSYDPGIAPAAMLVSLAAADFINHFLKNSGSTLLKNSAVSLDLNSSISRINYSVGF
ncbi:MAG: phosphatase PAP2 family protein [Bacteroidetes bacterium]|nr:phosphatase PAP2 family protein [Bacteroidota bacterium]